MRLIDSHCHLDVASFDADRGHVLQRARAAGIAAQIVPAIDAAGWPRLRTLCNAHDDLHPAYGLHPVYQHWHRTEHLQQLRDWIEAERPTAIGECGLDFFVADADREQQQTYLDAHMRLAREFDLPLVLHARRAVDAVIATIRRFSGVRGVVHSFAGSHQQARQLWDLGFCIGLGGPVTYSRANRLRGLAAEMPLEHLLLETDAPDQPDCHHRGQRNEPARLMHVLHAIAELRDADPAEIAATTTRNACRLFGLTLPEDQPGDAALVA